MHERTGAGNLESKTEREIRLFWIQVPSTIVVVCGIFAVELLTDYSILSILFSKNVFAALILLLLILFVLFSTFAVVGRLKRFRESKWRRR
jgi:uncharacterized membrane protein YhaH (DUF805 family)